jgi:glucose-1-phosphate thymidylyltransferase
MIAGPFTYGAGLHIWYSFQKKSQRFKIACLEELGYKDGWITKEKLMKIVVSLGNTHYGNYVKMIAEQYSGNG